MACRRAGSWNLWPLSDLSVHGPRGRRDTGLRAGRGDGVACAHETGCICALDCARARAWLRVWCAGGRRLGEEAALFWSACTCALGHADPVSDVSEEPGNSVCICCPLVVAMNYAELLPQPQPRQNPGGHPVHPPAPHPLLVCLLNREDDEASNPPHTAQGFADLCLSYRRGRTSRSQNNILTT